MKSKAIENAVAQWPEDISSLLHDDPQYRCEVWSRLAFSFASDAFPEAAYLLPAVEMAISTRPLDGIEDYTPPPYPGTPPEVKPLPNHLGTLTWLRGQFDHYLHDLQSAITKRKEAIESLEVFGDGIVQTKDGKHKVVALMSELERPLPEFPECLSSYVEFVERRQVDDGCRNAIAALLSYEVSGNEMKLLAIPAQFGTATQALERVRAFYERERNRVIAHIGAIQHPQGVTRSSDQLRDSARRRRKYNSHASEMMLPALLAHHEYDGSGGEDSIGNFEPIALAEMKKTYKVSNSVASRWFKDKFGGHDQYKNACVRDRGRRLGEILRKLSDENPSFDTGADLEQVAARDADDAARDADDAARDADDAADEKE